ncbi:MAG: DUF2194 domain-containing protein [bacterium]|nr:DUF2194 domain-containing protein [bacterium]
MKRLFLSFSIIIYSCQVFGVQEKVLVVYDPSIEVEKEIISNFGQALDYSKIPYELIDISTDINPEGYSLLLFATEMVQKLDVSTCDRIKDWVKDGGDIVVGIMGFNENLKEVFGITNSPSFISTNGLIFQEELFPGVEGLFLKERSEIQSLNVKLEEDVKVIAKSSDGLPLVWENSYEKGKVIYWNSCLLGNKEFRGFLIQSILKAQDIGVSFLANCGIIYIDDCSLPMLNLEMPPIDKKDTEFYVEDWFSGIIELGHRYGLRYTLANVFNYNKKTSPPFPMDEWNHGEIAIDGEMKRASPYLAHRFMEYGAEMGLHGYNHQPLVLDPLTIDTVEYSKGWESGSNIKEALNKAREQWIKDDLGPLPFTYVPPMDVYSKEGLKALHEAFPEIKVIGGAFFGNEEIKERIGLGDREFGPEPWNENLYCIPRVTAGYIMTESKRLTTISFIGNFGVWSHFIHPDDIYDQERRGPYDSWEGLCSEFDKYLESVTTNYPWLRWLTAKDAYRALVDYEEIKIESCEIEESKIYLKFSGYPIYFMVRINDGRAIDQMKISNCEAICTQNREGYNYLVFKATGKSVTLPITSRWVNHKPEIKVLGPSEDTECEEGFMIRWYDYDPDDDAKISLYYDTDNVGYDGTLIISGISEDDGDNKYYFDVSNLPQGTYYIYGKISDGINQPVYSYSQGRLIVKPVKTIDNVIAYPNPCFPDKGQVVYILNLPLDANTVYIYNIAGELVCTLEEEDRITKTGISKTAIWNVKDEKGKSVASGIYIYLLKSDKGVKVGKIAIIR